MPFKNEQERRKWFKEYNKKHYQANKASIREKQKIGYNKLRLEVLQAYSDSEIMCLCCGETHIEFLGIDHINGGGRQHRKTVGSGFYRWLKQNGYPDGFRVLCHNCNFSIGLYGYCPHGNLARKDKTE